MGLKDRVKKIAVNAARQEAQNLTKIRIEQGRSLLNATGVILSITGTTASVKLTDGTTVTADLGALPRVVGEPVIVIGGRII